MSLYYKIPAIFWTILGFIPIFMTGCYQRVSTSEAEPPVPVRVAQAELRDVQVWRYYTGNTEVGPINIVPRVRGILEQICFQPGEIVEKGAVLFKIEQFDYKNNVAQAQARMAIAEANLNKAKADNTREQSLKQKGEGYTTQADLDRDAAILAQTTADLALARENLAEAEKDLERTIISAPARGKIGRNLVEVGNLVDGSSNNPMPLATLMVMDPMYVYFQIPDADFIEFEKDITLKIRAKTDKQKVQKMTGVIKETTEKDKNRKLSPDPVLEFKMQLLKKVDSLHSTEFPYSGELDFSDNMVDLSTGTNTLRGRIDNPDYILFPGLVCRVRIRGPFYKNAVLVQEKAVSRDLNNHFVWVLDKNGAPQQRIITQGELLEDGWRIVLSGLTAGDRYILDGIQNVQPGCIIEILKDEGKTDPTKEPGNSQSGNSQSGTSQLGSNKSGSSQSGTSQSGSNQSGSNKSGNSQLDSHQPGGSQPGKGKENAQK